MSSNVLKGNRVALMEDGTRVIDTNEQISLKLEQLRELMQESKQEEIIEGFSEGLNAKQVEMLLTQEEGTSENEEPEYEGPDAQQLVQQALEEAEAIKQQASSEAAAMKQAIFDQAKNDGYQAGFQQGSTEATAKFAAKEQELEQKERKRIAEYKKQMEQMEPLFIDTLSGIYEHIFRVDLNNYRETIVYLIEHTLHDVEGTRDFMVHISKEDYPYVTMNKQQILSHLIGNATIEFVEDSLVPKNGCLIETDGGIFDCGVGTQLEELGKQLRMLSYEK